jgi:hypothetical protein
MEWIPVYKVEEDQLLRSREQHWHRRTEDRRIRRSNTRCRSNPGMNSRRQKIQDRLGIPLGLRYWLQLLVH